MASSVVEPAATESINVSGSSNAAVGASAMLPIADESELSADPPIWRKLWEGWKRVGKKIGNFQARVLLGIFYAVFLAPFAIMLRWRSDPLAIKPESKRGWLARIKKEESTSELAKRQF
jgi:hypothetical protein